MKNILLFLLLLFTKTIFSQDIEEKELELKKNSISLSILGASPVIGFVYDRVLSEKTSIEIGAGLLSFGAGFKYYPKRLVVNKLLFHTGFSGSVTPLFNSGELNFEGQGFIAYIPIGINYFGKKSIQITADIGPGTSYFNFEKIYLYGNLKFGVRF